MEEAKQEASGLRVSQNTEQLESRAEPWVLPLSFPLGRGVIAIDKKKKKIFLVMSRCGRGKS